METHLALLLRDSLAPLPPDFRHALLRDDPCDHRDCVGRMGMEEEDVEEEDVRMICSCCQGSAAAEGVPVYPLYKRLAAVLCECLAGGSASVSMPELEEDDTHRKRAFRLVEQYKEDVSALLEDYTSVNLRLHVQERFFEQLKDGTKIVEGRCSAGPYARLQVGDILLFNNLLYLKVKDIKNYSSFVEMLEAEGLPNVLPGVENVAEGVQIYRQFYTEEDESRGVLAIHVGQAPVTHPRKFLPELLSALQVEGVMSLLGIKFTKGTLTSALPPPRSLLLSSFLASANPQVPASKLTVGGRALSKHVHRSQSGWWGDCTGPERAKNKAAMRIICRIVNGACWINIHHLPQSTVIFEIRVKDGYGARWSSDGMQFRGFLEPPMKDGHACKWRH